MKTTTKRDPMTRHVGEVMHKGILSCDRDASLREVAQTMAEKRVHCVVVESGSGDAGPLWGVVSGLDLVAAASVRGLDEQTAGGSAASPVVTISARETLERATQLMTEHGTSHIIVIDEARLPVGVLSTLDVARTLSKAGHR
jgi:CBS domain-containing protein